MIPLLGLIIGLVLGLFISVDIPSNFAPYVAMTILTLIDAMAGGIASNLKNEFDFRLFATGLLGNWLIALALAALGEQLNLPLHYAAVFVFGYRIFGNYAIIRRLLIKAAEEKKQLADRRRGEKGSK